MVSLALLATSGLSATARPAWMPLQCSGHWTGWLTSPSPPTRSPELFTKLAGDSDWSATDPWATSGTPHKWPPGWLIVWPFDPKTSGLSDQPKEDGTWIMWAGTPYAHLMVMQK